MLVNLIWNMIVCIGASIVCGSGMVALSFEVSRVHDISVRDSEVPTHSILFFAIFYGLYFHQYRIYLFYNQNAILI